MSEAYDELQQLAKLAADKEVDRFVQAVANETVKSSDGFLETCRKIEDIFNDARMSENNWRDEGTEANHRILGYQSNQEFWLRVAIGGMVVEALILVFVLCAFNLRLVIAFLGIAIMSSAANARADHFGRKVRRMIESE